MIFDVFRQLQNDKKTKSALHARCIIRRNVGRWYLGQWIKRFGEVGDCQTNGAIHIAFKPYRLVALACTVLKDVANNLFNY